MKLTSTEVTKARVAKWLMQATPIDKQPTWTERRQAIVFGVHTYILTPDQVFQCAHCGRYDPQYSVTEVITFFDEQFGIKPQEIEVTCSVATISK
jgi:hypothetical protein